MDLTFIHVRKPQEIFEKGSKGKGRRRGLPAPLDPALRRKPLKGPFPEGTKVPRVAQEGRETRLEAITDSEGPGWGKRTMPLATAQARGAAVASPGTQSGMHGTADGRRPHAAPAGSPASPASPSSCPSALHPRLPDRGGPAPPPSRRRPPPPRLPAPRSGTAPSAPAPPAAPHPGGADVHHHLLEGRSLFGLTLLLQRDLLAELARIGSCGRGRAGPVRARRRHLPRASLPATLPDKPRPRRGPWPAPPAAAAAAAAAASASTANPAPA